MDLESTHNTCETETSEFSLSPLLVKEENLVKREHGTISGKVEGEIPFEISLD